MVQIEGHRRLVHSRTMDFEPGSRDNTLAPGWAQYRGLGGELDHAPAKILQDGWMGNVAVCEATCLAKWGHVHVCTTACACYGLCEEKRKGILEKLAEVGKTVFGNADVLRDMHSSQKLVVSRQRDWDLTGRGSAHCEEVPWEGTTAWDGPAVEEGATAEEGATTEETTA